MDMTPELFLKVAQYVTGELNRSELEDWVVPRLEALLSPASPGSHELVSELELDLAELTHGDIAEEEMKKSLRTFLQTKAMFVRLIEEQTYTTTEPLSVSQINQQEVVFART